MNKYIITLLATASFAVAATNEYDIVKGFDFTGATTITPSQLNQLVDNARTATNKGMTISANSAPDVANNPRYTNFLWLDYSTQPPTLKRWQASITNWTTFQLEVAANGIDTVKITNGAVTTTKIQDFAVTEAKISAGSVTESKLADGAVTRVKIANGAVDSTKLTNSAVSTANIADGAVTRVKLATDAVGGSSITNFGIGPNKLATNSVDNYAITNGAITGDKIAALSVTGTVHIAANSIETNHFSTNILRYLPHIPIGSGIWSRQFTNYDGVVANVVSNAAGAWTVNLSPSMTSTNYKVLTAVQSTGTNQVFTVYPVVKTVNSFTIETYQVGVGSVTPASWNFFIYAP
jgi:hypothetical protein